MAANTPAAKWDVNLAQAGTVRVTSPAPRDAWLDLLRIDRESLVFQSPAWTDTLVATGRYADASRLYEFANGRRVLLPMVRQTRLPSWLSSQASMPDSWGMGGLISSDQVSTEDVAAVLVDLAAQDVLRTSIRPNPLANAAWKAARQPGLVATPMQAHVLNLEGGFDHVWNHRFASETRTSVRKAERAGLVVECDTTGRLVPVFYDLFLRSVVRWAGMQHEPIQMARWRARLRDPLAKFQSMARLLGDRCRIWVAWLDGQPVASILVLQAANASYTRGAMDKNLAGPTRANQLLHRMAIEDACLAGCRWYHMGESGTSTSLSQFKSRLGAEAVPYAQYSLERFPVTKIDRKLRGFVKRMIGFKDAR